MPPDTTEKQEQNIKNLKIIRGERSGEPDKKTREHVHSREQKLRLLGNG